MIELLVIELLHQNLTHVSLKAVLAHVLAVLMVSATIAEALLLVVMHLVLTLVKNLAIHVHVARVIVLTLLRALVAMAHHAVHAALLKLAENTNDDDRSHTI